MKIGAKIVHHERYLPFQLAVVTVRHDVSAQMLCLIDRLRLAPLAP